MPGKVFPWVALGFGVALSLGGGLTALFAPPVSYQATAQVMLILPTTANTNVSAINPFVYVPEGLHTLARASVLSARGEAFKQDLATDGLSSKFELDAEIRRPIVRFSVEGAERSAVDADMAHVLSGFAEMVENTQREVGAPDRQLAKVTQFDSVPATAVSGDRTRAAVATALVGIFITLVAVGWIVRKRDRVCPNDPSPPPQSLAHRWRLPAVVFVITYAGLLLVIPSRLGIAAIGAPGKPASLWALLAIGSWALMAATGLIPRVAPQMRLATGLLGVAAVASYIAGNTVGWYQPADLAERYTSRWQLVSLRELNELMVSAGDRGLLAMAGWLGIVLVTAEGMRSWRDLELLVTWIVRFAAVVASLGLVQYYTNLNVAAMIQIPGLSTMVDFNTFSRSELNRVVSTAAHPIELGVSMAALFPLALHRSLHGRNVLAWIPTVLLGLMVLMSVSRSAVVVVACAGAVLFWGWPNRWRITVIVILPVLAVAGRAAFPGLLGTIRALFLNLESDPSVDGRTGDYPFVVSAFTENPLFGRGIHTWAGHYFRILDNQALVSLLELGVVGVLAFAYLLLTAIVGGIRCRRFTNDPRNRHLGLALSASVAGMALSYFTFDTWGFNQTAGLTFLLIGMAGAAYRLAQVGGGELEPSSLAQGNPPVPHQRPSTVSTDA